MRERWVLKWSDGEYFVKMQGSRAVWTKVRQQAQRFATKDDARAEARKWRGERPRIVRLVPRKPR